MSSPAMQPVACLSTRKEAPALIVPRFPILSLDERRLTPALGFIFDARWLLPGESIVSILWKFARANGLPGHALVPKTLQKVRDAIASLDYVPFAPARVLRSGRTRTIGIVAPTLMNELYARAVDTL